MQCVNDVVRIAGKITHYYTYCQLPTYLIEMQYVKICIGHEDWHEWKGLVSIVDLGDYVFSSGVLFKIGQFTLACRT